MRAATAFSAVRCRLVVALLALGLALVAGVGAT